MNINWSNIQKIQIKDLVCGHCGANTWCDNGYSGTFAGITVYIYMCHKCARPNYFDADSSQIPGPPYGDFVVDVPDQTVVQLYEEARNCTRVNAFTASVLCSRKLLMNIAVAKGAPEGKKFIDYVKYLDDQGFLPPGGKNWVDHIRKKGNEATHEILVMDRHDAEELILFLETLLKFIYEFPARIRKKMEPKSPDANPQ